MLKKELFMKKFFCIILSLSVMLSAAACGGSQGTEAEDSARDPSEIVGKPDVSEPVEDAVQAGQIRLMADSADLWICKDESYAGRYLYAVTDLDENGRYELISCINEGSGQFSTLAFLEVSEDGRSLEPLSYDYGNENSEPDIAYSPMLRCYSSPEGNHYVIADYIGNGPADTSYLQDWLTLREGRVDAGCIAYCSALADSSEYPEESGLNFYYYSGESDEPDLDRESFISAPDDRFEGCERRVCTLSWTGISADAARNEDELCKLLGESAVGFSFSGDEDVFDSLRMDPESDFYSSAVYTKDHLIGEWYITYIGGEYDMQDAFEIGADSVLNILGEPDDCKAYFSYNNPADARGNFLLTDIPVSDSDGYEAPSEGEFHVEFMVYEDDDPSRFYAEVDPYDGSLWVTWFWWDNAQFDGDPVITYLRYVKAVG